MQGAGLEAWELFCRRGERRLFGSLDLTLRPGEALHLVGPNGTGKSSLIQILAGLRTPSPAPELAAAGVSRGRVEWSGSVGLLDTRSALDEMVPVGKALDFWASVDGATPADLRAHAQQLGVAELLEVPTRYLSTGQRRRAAFVRLLMQGADHWLLDEPLNGLDSDAGETVEMLIAAQREQGGVVVVASHQNIALPGAQVLDLRDWPW